MRLRFPLIALAVACASDPVPSRDGGTSPRDAGPAPDGGPLGDAGTAPAAPCPDGSPMTRYSLTALAAPPALASIDLPNLHANTIIALAGSQGAHHLRLDVCTGGAPVLHAIQTVESSFETPRLYLPDPSVTQQQESFVETPLGHILQLRIPPSDLIVDGLTAALAGDLRALRIRILGMNGMLIAGHDGFIAAARGDVTPNSVVYTSLTVIVGVLAMGDAFAGRACPFGHNPLAETFRLGSATFEVGGCSFLGGGFTQGYEFHRLTIEDTSPLLMPADRAKLEFATKAEVDAVLTYRWNHHNACDSFHLALPHADYAASSAPMAGCGEQVPNAPPRTFDEPSNAPVRYRFRYYGGAWTDAEAMGCSSYLACR